MEIPKTSLTSKQEFLPAFYQVPREVYSDRSLEPVDHRIYGFVHYFHCLRDGKCIAGNAKIARMAFTTGRTVQNSLTRLEATGHIKRLYKDSSKKHRTQIIPVHSVERNSGASSEKLDGNHDDTVRNHDDTLDGNHDDQSLSKDIKSEQSNTGGKPPVTPNAPLSIWKTINGTQVDLVAETIHRFAETINPACKKMYNQKPQRQAAFDLIELKGWDLVEKVIALLPKTNRIAYLPAITTPNILWHKWADLEAGMSKMGNKKQAEQKDVLGLDDISLTL